MGSGVVTVGRRPYAAGLYWENSPTGRVAQTAREAARQPAQQADFYAIRPGNKNGRVPQFGLGQMLSGHKEGMPALAACIANQQPGSWAGAFRLPEGTVVIIVRDDLVVPDGDQFFVNENDARDRFLQEIGFGGLQRIYAPESWAISGTDTLPISLLLDDKHDIKLQSVTTSKQTLGVVAGIAVLVGLLFAGGWYYQKIQADNERERIAQQDALAAMRARANRIVPEAFQAAPEPVYPPPDRKWEKRPPLLDVVESCRVGLAGVVPALYGWKLSQLKCDGVTISINWVRMKGQTAIPEFQAPSKSTINDLGTNATTSIPLPPLSPRGSEALVNQDIVMKRYLALDWPGMINPLPEDPPPAPPADYKGKWNPPAVPWVKRSFTVTVQDLPGSLQAMFTGIPGAVVDSLTFSPSDSGGSWQIVGVIYENRH